MPVLLDDLVSQVVSVPDHILDTFKFSKYLGLALDPASTLYPQNINIRHTQNIFQLYWPKKHFPNLNIDLKKPQIDRNDTPPQKKNVQKINHNFIIHVSPNIFIFLISCPPPPPPPPQQKCNSKFWISKNGQNLLIYDNISVPHPPPPLPPKSWPVF